MNIKTLWNHQMRHTPEHIHTLLAPDMQRSPLATLSILEPGAFAFTAFGYRESDHATLIGFQGHHREVATGHYMLGNGYRTYNPVLMRFNSPDMLSPFSSGGLNTYAYALNDPINNADPTGRTPQQRTYKYIGAARKIKGDITVFMTTDDETGQLTLNLIAHGIPGLIGSSKKWYTPKKMIKRLEAEGYSPKNQPINIFACHTANPATETSPSFIQTFSKLTKQTATGFQNIVTTRTIEEPLNKIKIGALERIMLDKHNYRADSHMLFFSVHTTNPDPENQKFNRFSYSPMTASPSGEMTSIRQA